MKNKLIYSFLILFSVQFYGQQIQFNLVKGGISLFNGSLYTYGLSTDKQHPSFYIYRLDLELKTKDSLIVTLSKTNSDNYLPLSSDTLHNYLNIYLQEKNKKLVTVFRFTKNFELLATVENVDIARLNNPAMLGDDPFYYRSQVYSIRIQNDTSGKQYFLNKYTLKSDVKNFDYTFTWQFPFEKKEIRSAHIIYVNEKQVVVYISISSGIKAGQWVVKIDAETGKLIHATKLNAKSESFSYLFGNFMADTITKSLTLLGEKLSDVQFNPTQNKLTISNRPFAWVYIIEIDSSGDIVSKQDFKIPITAISSGAKKTTSNYLLRFLNPEKKTGTFSFDADIYSNTKPSYCYSYVNTTRLRIIESGDKPVLEKGVIASNPLIEKFYFTNDQLDANGKLCIDSLNQFETIFYKPVIFPIKQSFKTDADNNPAWTLTKLNVKKNTVVYAVLQPVKKIYTLTTIDEISKAINPGLVPLSNGLFLISTQPEETKYQLKLFTW